MRRKSFWIAASWILAVIGMHPVFSSGASPASKEKVIYSFTGGVDGGNPLSDLTLDAAGNLYGTTSQGGTGTACGNGGCGTVFELKRTRDGWKEQVLYSFGSGTDGAAPHAGVIFDDAGNLYGTTFAGGTHSDGTVFKLTPNLHGGWTESVLYSFTFEGDGANPNTDLAFDAAGNLFGTASAGGGRGEGTVFELMRQANGSWKESTIYQFGSLPDGSTPSSAVVLDSLGNIFGLTEFGGNGKCQYVAFYLGCGIAYELTPISAGKWAEKVIYDFARGGGSGVNPSAGLILDHAGQLIGTTLVGGDGLGTVFELTQSEAGSKQRVVHRFYGNPDGIWPVGRLGVNADGALVGVASHGGANKAGVVFELRRSGANGWRELVLHAFTGNTDGSNPQAGVVSDSHGHLYGTTQQGGSGTGCNFGCGTVYEVRP